MSSLLNRNSSQIEAMTREIESHVSWSPAAGLNASEVLLQGHKPFTYLLRKGDLPYQYLISFVDQTGIIQHRPIYIEYSAQFCKWYFLNGSTHTRWKLSDLIPVAMHCAPIDCRPLVCI